MAMRWRWRPEARFELANYSETRLLFAPRLPLPIHIVRVPDDTEVAFTDVGVNVTMRGSGVAGLERKPHYVLRCRTGDVCDFNHRNERGRTALMQAADKPDIDFMQDLLAHGADPHIQASPGGETVLWSPQGAAESS